MSKVTAVKKILRLCRKGLVWADQGHGHGHYEFRLDSTDFRAMHLSLLAIRKPRRRS